MRREKPRMRAGKGTLYIADILAWADAFFERTGRWPNRESGPVAESKENNWAMIDGALKVGRRGLPRGSSLAILLQERRGRRHHLRPPRLSVAQILRWVDLFHARTGTWPHADTGAIPEAPGESWLNIQTALMRGIRGLSGGCSLARLLDQRRGVRNKQDLPALNVQQILVWADEHHTRTGNWPTCHSGSVPAAAGETWKAIEMALVLGGRGLRGGSTLAQLFAKHRGHRNRKRLAPLRTASILAWADEHYQRTGRWPSQESGPVAAAAGETWSGIDDALRAGFRGLPGGSTLPKLLSHSRGT